MGKVENLQKEYDEEVEKLHKRLNAVPLGLGIQEYMETVTPYYNKVEKISRELRLIKPYEMSELPTYGDFMTMEDFKEYCNSGGFIDSDGSGNYATKTQMSNISVYPSDVTSDNLRNDFTHVVWFNK